MEHQGAGDGDALFLTAREFVREAIDRGVRQAAAVEHGAALRSDVVRARVGSVDYEWFGEDVADTHARVERAAGVLKDDLHVASQFTQRARRCRENIPPVEYDTPRSRGNEAQYGTPHGRFARSRFPDQRERLAACDTEGDRVDHRACRPPRPERDAKRFDFEERWG